jgi:hypothetical protein
MMTLRQLIAEPPTLPTRTTGYWTDLAEARGRQELFTANRRRRSTRPKLCALAGMRNGRDWETRY